MTTEDSGSRAARTFVAICVAALLMIGAGCGGGGGGHPRGQFTGYVMDQNEEEVTAKVGKPDVVDNASPNIVKWTYKSKTFDPDNNNQSDKEAILILTRDPASGKLKVTDVQFNN